MVEGRFFGLPRQVGRQCPFYHQLMLHENNADQIRLSVLQLFDSENVKKILEVITTLNKEQDLKKASGYAQKKKSNYLESEFRTVHKRENGKRLLSTRRENASRKRKEMSFPAWQGLRFTGKALICSI